MALQQREKKLVGMMMIAGALALLIGVGLPQWDTVSASMKKMDEINADLKNLKSQKETLAVAIAALEEQAKLPNDAKVRTYTADTLQKTVKEMLDMVVKFSTDNQNLVIALKPWPEVPSILPPPPPPDPKAATGAPATGADANTPPAPPPPPPLTTIGYELSIRGTYSSIRGFLNAMNDQREIIELSSIQLLNEAGADRAGGKGNVTDQDAVKDPTKPIRLTAKLRLVLQDAALQ